jgi:hypothetical protein
MQAMKKEFFFPASEAGMLLKTNNDDPLTCPHQRSYPQNESQGTDAKI